MPTGSAGRGVLLVVTWIAAGVSAVAVASSPVGLWKTIDDKSGEARSYVRIVERNGVLSGRIEEILDVGKRDARCKLCEDARKDQPVRGMVIIEGMRLNARAGYWEGGTILDPNDGKIYRLRLTPKRAVLSSRFAGSSGPSTAISNGVDSSDEVR